MSTVKSRSAGGKPPPEVPCPTCGKPAVFAADNPWRPFCCERCRLVDLGAWATESYRIPAKPAEDSDDAEADPKR